MDDFEVAAIEHIIRSQVGTNAAYERYDRTNRSPMNFVLDEAERQLSQKFVVYWVNGGFPENFYLSGFTMTPVIWSSRYLEIVSLVRNLIVDDSVSNFRVELSERACLRVIAELALLHGDTDLAVLAFLESVVGSGFHFSHSNVLQDLELATINESYMIIWFWGLIHELGHSASTEMELTSEKYPGFDQYIRGALERVLATLPADLRREGRLRTQHQKHGHSLSMDNLRSEALADVFATNVLFQSTLDIMPEVQREFDTVQFLLEMALMLSTMNIIERCSAVASIGTASDPDRDSLTGMALHPASLEVRALTVRWYLAIAGASLASDPDPPSQERLDRWQAAVDEVSFRPKEAIDEVDSGLARAMRFVLFPWEREPNLMASFADELSRRPPNDTIMSRLEAKQFCDLAKSVGATGEALHDLRSVVERS